MWTRGGSAARLRRAAATRTRASTPAFASRGFFTATRRSCAPEDGDNRNANNASTTQVGGGGIDSLPDYFFDLRPDNDVAGHHSISDTASFVPPPPSSSSSSLPAPPPPLPPPRPPLPGVSAGEWAEFQQHLRQVEDVDPEFLAYAASFASPVDERRNLHFSRGGKATAEEEEDRADTWAEAGDWKDGVAAPQPPMSVKDVAELEQDLSQEDARDEQLFAASPHGDGVDAAHCTSGDAGVEFGFDAEHDAEILAALKGRATRLQNVADTVDGAPLKIPSKDGSVTAPRDTADAVDVAATLAVPHVRLLSSHSYLVQQDRMYLAARTPSAAQLPPHVPRQCVLVVFSANDLRVHDNHLLALASVRARAAVADHDGAGHAGVGNGDAPLPVIAVCVLDYRTFAQPSVVGGFFRQSPQRAQFLLDTVAALRRKLEAELQVPLLVRCGRPEEHVPRLAAELGATDVFLTTQYAPHERRVQALLMRRLRQGVWVSRQEVADALDEPREAGNAARMRAARAEEVEGNVENEDDAPLMAVIEHRSTQEHPYGQENTSARASAAAALPVVHSVWQTTLVHLDDLPTSLAAMKEGERWYHDDVTVSTIRPTAPYDAATQQLASLPTSPQQAALLPSRAEQAGRAPPSVLRGALPRLEDLGYAAAAVTGTDFAFEEVIATQSSHPTAGEEAALARLHDWLAEGGMTSLLRYGRERRTNTKMYSQRLARVSPYIALGALSPRKYYEVLREHAHANQRDGFVQQQFREALLRLSRRDYWHWMGLRFGDRLFFSYGPHPEQTDEVPDWRHDTKVVQRWCTALTGIPFADAAMRELVGTGFVAHEGRQALAWLLTRGYGQDWRLGAEWMERCSLDYDPFICYGNFAYYSGLMRDDFGEPVRNVHWLAHQHDQTGIYIKKWLPQLSKVPPVYIHRPHVLTARMQAMHNVYLGKNYPYPLKLWQGAQRTLTATELTAYYAQGIRSGPGYAEALRYGAAVMSPEEFSAAVTPAYMQHRGWASLLPASAFADVAELEGGAVGEVTVEVKSRAPTHADAKMTAAHGDKAAAWERG